MEATPSKNNDLLSCTLRTCHTADECPVLYYWFFLRLDLGLFCGIGAGNRSGELAELRRVLDISPASLHFPFFISPLLIALWINHGREGSYTSETLRLVQSTAAKVVYCFTPFFVFFFFFLV